jgi:Glycosyltransferase WbsX
MDMRKSSLVAVVASLLFLAAATCCGSTLVAGRPEDDSLKIEALSPNSSAQQGAEFVLSVVGKSFTSGSVVQWSGSNLATTFVSSKLITAQVRAGGVSMPGSYAVTVVDPEGEESNAVSFVVPCVVAPLAAAATQTRAQVGAYYFDGWSGPLTNFHFDGLPLGSYNGRQPLSGWQDSNTCAMERELAWAHNFGVDFFIFDRYWKAEANEPGDNLNSALEITHRLADRHGMKYAILYVDGQPFDVSAAEWPAAVSQWIKYMKDPAYMCVDGKPIFFVIDVGEMYGIFGSDSAVRKALGQFREAARAQGLAGVYVVGGFGIEDGTMGQDTLMQGFEMAQADGYDAAAFYNYPFAPRAVNGKLPFSTLSEAGHWTWNQAEDFGSLAFIPTAMAGWDPRPWDEVEPNTGDLMWYSRTPAEVATFLEEAIAWANSNPQIRPQPAPAPPLVLIEAWNEFGEGSYILPTTGNGFSYGNAIADMLLKSRN